MKLKGAPFSSLAYMAGLFDGEGCVRGQEIIGRGRPAFALEVNFANKYKPAALAFEQRFGGSVYFLKDCSVWYWSATGVNAQKALRALLPYLTVKREQAKVALRWKVHSKGFNKKLSNREYQQRRNIIRTLKRLKHAY